MLDVLPHWWDKKERASEGSDTYEILYSFSQEFGIYGDSLLMMKSEIYVDTSTGPYLDALGKLFLLTRKPNETDANFRARIKSFRNTFTGGGTNEAIETGIFEEFNGAVANVTDSPGATWCKATVNISSSDWVGKIQGSEAVYYDLLERVKAAGIWLGTTIYMVHPSFNETNWMAERFNIEANQAFFETQDQAEDYRFIANLSLPIGPDMVWDVDNWDEANWIADSFLPKDIVSFNVSTHWEDTINTGEEISLSSILLPFDTESHTEFLTYVASKVLSDTETMSDIFTVSAETRFGDTMSNDEDYRFSSNLSLLDTESNAEVLLFGANMALSDTGNQIDSLNFGIALTQTDTLNRSETISEAIFLNIPTSTMNNTETVSITALAGVSETQNHSEEVIYDFNLVWDGTGQEGDWDTGAWSS